VSLIDSPHQIHLAENPARGRPGLFLDRDGTLIEDPGYVSDPGDVRPIPGVAAAINRFRAAGFAVVVVTNQSGIGRGLYGWRDYEAVAIRVATLYSGEGVEFDAVLACGHSPDTDPPCDWRKPAPGMIREAAALLALDLSRSLLVGDKLSDLQAAEAAGVPRAVHVISGQGGASRPDVKRWRTPMAVDLLDDLSVLSP